jgi:hypothetical protein
MQLSAVPVHAGLLALLFVWLSVRVIGARRRGRVAIGVGEDRLLERRVRAHGNFAEYVPFALLLLALLEGQGWPIWLVHGLCLALSAGRLAHAWGVSNPDEDFRFRVGGMAATMTVMIASALLLCVGTVMR